MRSASAKARCLNWKKQIYQLNKIGLKNLNWLEADQLAI